MLLIQLGIEKKIELWNLITREWTREEMCGRDKCYRNKKAFWQILTKSRWTFQVQCEKSSSERREFVRAEVKRKHFRFPLIHCSVKPSMNWKCPRTRILVRDFPHLGFSLVHQRYNKRSKSWRLKLVTVQTYARIFLFCHGNQSPILIRIEIFLPIHVNCYVNSNSLGRK